MIPTIPERSAENSNRMPNRNGPQRREGKGRDIFSPSALRTYTHIRASCRLFSSEGDSSEITTRAEENKKECSAKNKSGAAEFVQSSRVRQ